MSPGYQILLGGLFTFGVPLCLAVRELLAIRRGGRGWWGGDERRRRVPDPPPPPPAPQGQGVPPGKPLPDCLIPRPIAPRTPVADRKRRELEPV
jgi:hypothetical protein